VHITLSIVCLFTSIALSRMVVVLLVRHGVDDKTTRCFAPFAVLKKNELFVVQFTHVGSESQSA
jgi:hypothetical protein